MIKVNEILLKIKQNLPELAFLFFSIRLISLGASIGDAIALISLTGLLGYNQFISSKVISKKEEIEKDLADIKTHLTALKLKQGIRSLTDEAKESTTKRYF